MRLFGSDRIMSMVQALNIDEEQPIEYGILSKQIEQAQKKLRAGTLIYAVMFLQYDNVMNVQREVIYSQRRSVLQGDNSVTP